MKKTPIPEKIKQWVEEDAGLRTFHPTQEELVKAINSLIDVLTELSERCILKESGQFSKGQEAAWYKQAFCKCEKPNFCTGCHSDKKHMRHCLECDTATWQQSYTAMRSTGCKQTTPVSYQVEKDVNNYCVCAIPWPCHCHKPSKCSYCDRPIKPQEDVIERAARCIWRDEDWHGSHKGAERVVKMILTIVKGE